MKVETLFELKASQLDDEELVSIPIAHIDIPGEASFDEGEVIALADNIHRIGLMNRPIVVRHGSRFEVKVGRRRVAAMRLISQTDLAVTHVQCYVRRRVSPSDIAKLVLSENAQRSANVLAELDSINTLLGPPERLSIDAVAKSVGQSPSWVHRRTTLNKLLRPFLDEMRRGHLGFETARAISKLDKDQQRRVLTVFQAKKQADPDAVVSGKDLATAMSTSTANLPAELFAALPSLDGTSPVEGDAADVVSELMSSIDKLLSSSMATLLPLAERDEIQTLLTKARKPLEKALGLLTATEAAV